MTDISTDDFKAQLAAEFARVRQGRCLVSVTWNEDGFTGTGVDALGDPHEFRFPEAVLCRIIGEDRFRTEQYGLLNFLNRETIDLYEENRREFLGRPDATQVEIDDALRMKILVHKFGADAVSRAEQEIRGAVAAR